MNRTPTPRLAASSRKALTAQHVSYFGVGEPLATPWLPSRLPETTEDSDLVRPVPKCLTTFTSALMLALALPSRFEFCNNHCLLELTDRAST